MSTKKQKIIRYGEPKIVAVMGSDNEQEFTQDVKTVQRLNKKYAEDQYKVSVVELRLDMLGTKWSSVRNLIKIIKEETNLPLMVSCRRICEIGYYAGSEKQRLDMLEDLVEGKSIDIVDIEYNTNRKREAAALIEKCNLKE